MPRIGKALPLAGAVVAGLSTAVLRALRLTTRQPAALPEAAEVEDGGAAVAARLADLVRIRTVSHDGRPTDGEAFRALHEYLERTYPALHGALEREVVGGHSLLYTWRGEDSSLRQGRGSEHLRPVLLMAHLDVVPVEDEGDWVHPPFVADRAEGFLWGRGAMDDKASVVGIMEAVERLVTEDFRPSRTVYLAFGHDEEVGGTKGAAAVAELLRSRGVRLAMVLDEGGFIGEGWIPGVRRPVALVGTAEKGFLSLELTAEGDPGHSSSPPRQTAIGIVARAIARLERNQMPARLEAIQKLYEFLAPELPLPQRTLAANFPLVAPVLVRRLAADPTTNALVRTTTAPTIVEGGIKQNVLPRRARAVVNFRILPGDTIQEVMEHVRRVVGDPRLRITPLEGHPAAEAAPEASLESEGFRALARTIAGVFPDAVVAPWTLIGMTDSRHYLPLADDVYRFVPFRVTPDDRRRVHGPNERIRLSDCSDLVRFYLTLLREVAG